MWGKTDILFSPVLRDWNWENVKWGPSVAGPGQEQIYSWAEIFN